MLAASPMRAQSTGAPAGAQKKVVVRADSRTGKLVTRVVTVKRPAGEAAAAPGPAAAPTVHTTDKPAATPAPGPAPGEAIDVAGIVEEAARANGVDPLLVHSVIQVESNYNPYAVSPQGARGLMQLMPPTARQLGVSDSFDARQNIEAGVRYLKYLQDLYKDDRLALAAYNAGPAAVQKYNLRVPPYPETQAYVERVGNRYSEARKVAGFAAGGDIPQAPVVSTAEETHPKLERFVDEKGRLYLRTAPE